MAGSGPSACRQPTGRKAAADRDGAGDAAQPAEQPGAGAHAKVARVEPPPWGPVGVEQVGPVMIVLLPWDAGRRRRAATPARCRSPGVAWSPGRSGAAASGPATDPTWRRPAR